MMNKMAISKFLVDDFGEKMVGDLFDHLKRALELLICI